MSDDKPFGDRQTRRFEEAPQGRLLKAGDIVANRYEVESPLGEGGAGAVYKVRDRQTNRPAALKIVLPDRIAKPGALEALAAEAAIARDIRHPNIVGVYDVRAETDPPFITMEFVAGRSLWSWMTQHRREKSPWPMATAASIVRAVLDGLEAAHAAGVVHRDIKPENIILTADPAPGRTPLKIIDFGIASAGATHAAGASEGTLAYMAPEGRYSRDELGPSADLYSLSVIFYELLVAALPQYWSPPSHGRADTPAAIDNLIRDGLSPNALVRPQTAEAYRKRLDAALAPKAEEAAPVQAKAREQTAPPPKPASPPEPPSGPTISAMLEQAQALRSKASDMARANAQDWHVPWNNAHQLHKDAAATGDLVATVAYGRFLEQGLGGWVAPQYEVARSWYESAAKRGFGPAMAALGEMERFGRGCPKNAAASIAWYVKAGEAGYAAGDYLAGFAYRAKLRDWGGIVDYQKARYHLERAARKGDGAAMLHLGEMLADGQGGSVDRASAKVWFEAAIKAGHASGADRLKEYGLG